MIDVESQIFNIIAPKIRAAFTGAFITGEYVKAPAQFPCVSIIEESNSTYQRSLDAELQEHHASTMFQTDVFSNLTVGKKSQCRAIQKLIDEEFFALGFIRIFSQPTPNYENATIFRITSRYKGVISEDGRIYRT